MAVIYGLVHLLSSPVDEMAATTSDGIGLFNLKKTGSIIYDIKQKSLIEHWLPSDWKMVEDDDAYDNHHVKVIQRNVHVKLEIHEGNGTCWKSLLYLVRACHIRYRDIVEALSSTKFC